MKVTLSIIRLLYTIFIKNICSNILDFILDQYACTAPVETLVNIFSRSWKWCKDKLPKRLDENNEQSTSDDPTVSIRFKPKVDNSNDERIQVQIHRTISTYKYCCVCSFRNAITVVPEDARMQAFIKMKIYIPAGNRCCQSHSIKYRFYDENLSRLRVHLNSSSLTASKMTKMMKSLSIRC